MALVKNVNSYVTINEANTYFEDRLDVAAWTTASDAQKSQALITATKLLDELNWTGVAVSASQSLAFPRSGTYYDPKIGMEVELTSSIPNRILLGTYELAYHLLNNDGVLDETGSVRDISVGGISLNSIIQTSKIPKTVKSLIKPLQTNSGANLWWRAN